MHLGKVWDRESDERKEELKLKNLILWKNLPLLLISFFDN